MFFLESPVFCSSFWSDHCLSTHKFCYHCFTTILFCLLLSHQQVTHCFIYYCSDHTTASFKNGTKKNLGTFVGYFMISWSLMIFFVGHCSRQWPRVDTSVYGCGNQTWANKFWYGAAVLSFTPTLFYLISLLWAFHHTCPDNLTW